MDAFWNAFDQITGTGRFCSTGSVPFFFPQISIAGAEELAFPLCSAQVDQIIKESERAPFGQGESTIFDETVRKSWQVDASDLVIDSPKWSKQLKKWLTKIATDLGVEGEVDAQLYKLLLYGEGGHFKAHRDTEKLDAMFGTLIIALPSKHSGGTLWIRHAGEEQAVDFSAADHIYEFQYAALFADCEHEVTPVMSGYRCCLVYNLSLKQGDPTLLNSQVPEQAALLQPHLEADDFREMSGPRVVLLQHQYTEANFSLAGLKNNDQARARALLMAAESAGYVAHLGLVTLHQEGELEDADYGYSRRRRWDDEYEDDADDGEMGEIYSQTLSVGNWVDARGDFVELGDFELEPEQLLTRQDIDAEDPIEKEGEGSTGNAGCTMDYWYRRGAVVFWPKAEHAKIQAESNSMAACAQLLEQAKLEGAAAKPAFLELGAALIKVFANQPEPIGDYVEAHAQALLVRAIGQASSLPLLREAIGRLGVCHFRSCSAKDWGVLLERFEAHELLPLLQGLGDGSLNGQRVVVFEVLDALLASAPDTLRAVGGHFVERASGFKPKSARRKSYDTSQPTAIDEAHRLIAGSFLTADENVRQSIREFAMRDQSLEALRMTLIPALLEPHGAQYYQEKGSLFPEILDWVKERLAQEVERALLPYPDWARSSNAEIERSYPRFSTFLKDPSQKIYVYPALKEIRERMKRTIESAELDVVCEMVKKGSPHQIVCTKNSASYKRALRVRSEDEQRLEALRGL